MHRKDSERLIFGCELGFVIVALALFTLTCVAAEAYLTNQQMLADIELANGYPSGGITVTTEISR